MSRIWRGPLDRPDALSTHLARRGRTYEGYGHCPTWRRRQNAVLNKCRWALDFATSLAESNATLVAIREQRLEATATFRE